MMYSAAVLVAVLGGANGFTMTKAPTRMSTLKMQADPWFPRTSTSNTVSIDALKYVDNFFIFTAVGFVN